MGNTAWPTITDVNTYLLGMNVTLPTSVGTPMINGVIDSVVANINNTTKRTWIPVVEDRYFHGSDMGELEIDEYIAISSVEVVGWFAQNPGLQIINTCTIERQGLPNTRIGIYRGTLPANLRNWLDRFPLGRDNIKINANWGYDTTIPSDLWLGCTLQSAFVLANLSNYQQEGFLVKWQEADVTEVKQFMDPFKFFSIGKSYNDLLKFYTRSSSTLLRKQTKRLV